MSRYESGGNAPRETTPGKIDWPVMGWSVVTGGLTAAVTTCPLLLDYPTRPIGTLLSLGVGYEIWRRTYRALKEQSAELPRSEAQSPEPQQPELPAEGSIIFRGDPYHE